MQLLREVLKPFYKWMSDGDYREYLYVKRKCRGKKRTDLNILGFNIEVMNAEMFLHLYEEIVVRKALDAEFKVNDPVIVCAGANAGLELFLLKKKYPAAKITAYEADPDYATTLKRNIERNGLKDFTIINAAIWTEKGKVPFIKDGGLGGKVGTGGTDIPSLRFADELNKFPHIHLLLIDVEGAENLIVPDCADQLENVDALFVEWHGRENEVQLLPELLDPLSLAGFRYQVDNKIGVSPFKQRLTENGFDAMAGIYATRPDSK